MNLHNCSSNMRVLEKDLPGEGKSFALSPMVMLQVLMEKTGKACGLGVVAHPMVQ